MFKRSGATQDAGWPIDGLTHTHIACYTHSDVDPHRQVERGLQAGQLADQAAPLQRRLELIKAGRVAQRHQRLALVAQQLLSGAGALHKSVTSPGLYQPGSVYN